MPGGDSEAHTTPAENDTPPRDGLSARVPPTNRESIELAITRSTPSMPSRITIETMKPPLPSLTDLAIKHRTDKWGQHFYTPHYEHHFKHLRELPINLLEIGVGGFEDPREGGESLRMWKEFFPNAKIYGIDIHDKSRHEEERITIFRGSQVDRTFLESVAASIGRIDLIIDDGSHINWHIIETFKILFPILHPDGIYAIEDLQTSYLAGYGGDSFNLRRRKTAMNFLKSLADSLNFQEFDNPYYQPTYFDLHITALSFYHNLAFVQKGPNAERSNLSHGNRLQALSARQRLRYAILKARSWF